MKLAYLTTPIYYVNDIPHIGGCYTNIIGDVLARLYAMRGHEVRLQTGTDEHGQKIIRAAESRKLSTMQFCNMISKKFRDLCIDTNVCCAYPEFDSASHFNQFDFILANRDHPSLFKDGCNFIRTTEGRDIGTGEISDASKVKGRHIKAAEKFWQQLDANGWIYRGKYSGWYSIQEETFYKESELVLAADGSKLTPFGAVVEWHEESVYFFRLSAFQDILLNLYESCDILKPANRKAEICSFIKSGLDDLCISRANVPWGIPTPTDDTQTMYVWVDALINYISALNYGDEDDASYKKWWQNNENIIHILGKDIFRFHAIYWPALLLAANYSFAELMSPKNDKENVALKLTSEQRHILPSTILVHGWWTNEGNKISKSLGNTVDPYKEITWLQDCFKIEYKTAVDYFRYFLIRAMPLGHDGDYSRSRLVTLINAELVNNVGNFVYRTLPIINKHCDEGRALIGIKAELPVDYPTKLEESVVNFNLYKIIESALQYCTSGNRYIEHHKPWNMLKSAEDREHLYVILRTVLERVVHTNIILRAFIPTIADGVLDYLNWPIEQRNLSCISQDNHVKFASIMDNALSAGLVKPRHFYPSLRESSS
jgi:methionyl-tRNA synthetase